MTGADLIIARLHQYGVQQIFGYPGGQIAPIYDALARADTIRHYLTRDEQAAAFMADGYARATGLTGVCLAVCGPGVLNAATPLATAYTDSTPVLLISGQIYGSGLGLRTGYYHENEQLQLCETCTKWSARPTSTEEIIPLLDQAYAATTEGRPGPVLFEVPLDLLREEVGTPEMPPLPCPAEPSAPDVEESQQLCDLIAKWEKPLLLVGGGAVTAEAQIQIDQLARRLGSPIFHTAMGKSAVSAHHPLFAGMPWQRATSDLTDMKDLFSPLFAQADGLLILGSRLTQMATGNWTMPLPNQVAQIDIDGEELGRHAELICGIEADLKPTLEQMLQRLPDAERKPWADPKTRNLSEPWLLDEFDLVTPLREALPEDAIVIADITRMAYIMMVEFAIYHPRTFLHPAGYVPMGFGIPAALGAKAAYPDRPVVAVVGDGCFMMSGLEMATAIQEQIPVVIVLINDSHLTLIKALQERRYGGRLLGVKLQNPDFGMFARSFGAAHQRVEGANGLKEAIQEGLASDRATLIEVCI